MKYPKIIENNVVFNPEDDYSAVEKIEGHLKCCGADIRNAFPKLTEVGSWLDCRKADTRNAFPKLTTVGWYLDCREVNTQTVFPELTAVGDWLDCRETDIRNAFPKLTAVGWYLDCCGATDIHNAFPELTVVGGWLDCREADTRGAFPKLTAIGDWLGCYGAITQGNFPKLTTTDIKTAQQQVQAAFRKSGFAFFDGILAEILTTRHTTDDATVYKLRIVGRSAVSYGIELGDVFSHGDTVKEARSSLLYKVSDRDKSAYTGWSLDRRITARQAVESYRVITGACESGTRNFVESVHKRKKYYTVQEVIELTEKQYGHEQYRNFFTNKQKEQNNETHNTY